MNSHVQLCSVFNCGNSSELIFTKLVLIFFNQNTIDELTTWFDLSYYSGLCNFIFWPKVPAMKE